MIHLLCRQAGKAETSGYRQDGQEGVGTIGTLTCPFSSLVWHFQALGSRAIEFTRKNF